MQSPLFWALNIGLDIIVRGEIYCMTFSTRIILSIVTTASNIHPLQHWASPQLLHDMIRGERLDAFKIKTEKGWLPSKVGWWWAVMCEAAEPHQSRQIQTLASWGDGSIMSPSLPTFHIVIRHWLIDFKSSILLFNNVNFELQIK